MVEKLLLAVFIVTCALGLAVVLDLFQLHVHSIMPCLRSLQQNHHKKVFNWEITFVQGDWQSKIWQKIHWFIVFHISILGDL